MGRAQMAISDDDVLLRAARTISRGHFEDTFAELTRTVAELLDCEIGLLGRYVEVDGVPSITTLACYMNGERLPDGTYPLAGTPCETVIGNEFRIYPRDVGRRFPIVEENYADIDAYSAYPLFDRRGEPLGILTVMSSKPIENRDRTETLLRIFSERAVAEMESESAAAELRSSEAQYQAIFDAALDGLVLLEANGDIVDANAETERMFGYSREELRGRSVVAVLARDRMDVGHAFLEAVRTNAYAETTESVYRRDHSLIDIEIRAVTLDYRGARHILANVRDVSGDLARDAALQRSETLLRATVEAGLDCIIVMDEQGAIVEFNPAAERCFGIRRDAAVGQPLAQLILPARYRAELETGLSEYLARGAADVIDRRLEVSAVRQNGEEFPVELTIGVAQPGGETIFIAYLRDITERHEAEAQRQTLEGQLRQAQKMEALGHLTGGVAHDFNNILTSVLGYVEMAAERAQSVGDERIGRYLTRARLASERARDLVQQMLTFSRGQQGEPRAVQLHKVVDEGMYLLEATMPSTIAIHKSLDTKLPAVVVDPVHLEQVLVNLCINARDAMKGEGALTVTTCQFDGCDCVCSSCHQPVSGQFVELRVSDNGPGLAPALVERIFEPFFSTKEAGKGSGMGLATVHGIVHEYGGHIIVDSAPGAGSTFRVFLPLDREPVELVEADEDTADNNPAAVFKGRVMIVDDDLVVAEFLEELLSGWGLDVTPFANAQAALRQFAGAPLDFDLVITDQTMPEVTGLELGRKLMSMRPDLPVVLYTGFSETVTEPIALDAGFRALVYKPLDIPALRELLAGILPAA